jgi:hypothetical protein
MIIGLNSFGDAKPLRHGLYSVKAESFRTHAQGMWSTAVSIHASNRLAGHHYYSVGFPFNVFEFDRPLLPSLYCPCVLCHECERCGELHSEQECELTKQCGCGVWKSEDDDSGWCCGEPCI